MEALFDIPENAYVEHWSRSEETQWGQRAIRDGVLIGKRGTVRSSPSEESARGYDGAHYPGGPKMFEPVRRTIVTYTGAWEVVEGE